MAARPSFAETADVSQGGTTMFKTVIWATDGSETADQALAYAKKLVASSGGTLCVVHAEEHFYGGRSGGYPVLADEEDLKAKIRSQVEELRADGFEASLEIVVGHPGQSAHAIIEFARDRHADVIVVGTRGLGPVHGLLVGSVTHRLLHTAPCPVLAVPAVPAAKNGERRRQFAGTAGS
jgi:nucleotide-binding universal stress UspA family protein